ncbi:MAG TPA: Gfo/Idh/MocA family oxidoreductase [Anaerolineae bacterium]|nr:Gfo/Idh/MocA family oxidoreductase [Anaerolineae bacterium]
MPESKPLRVGVIGAGGIAQMMHLHYLFSMPERYQIAALSDLSQGLLESMGDKYRVPENCRFTHYQDLVAQDLDAVLILTGGNHYGQALAALHAGKHVFVEKPMCYTLHEADEMIEAAKRANRKLMVGYMKRYDPGYLYGQRAIKSLREIRYVQINTLHPAETGYQRHHNVQRFRDIPPDVLEPLQKADDASVIQAVGHVSPLLREIYANVVIGSMVHDVNALRGLMGEPEEVLFTQLWPEDRQDVCITTALKYPNDVRVIYTWAYLDELRDYFQEIAIMASSGRVRIQFPSPYLRHFPTPVVVQGMEDGASYTKQIVVSYEEAFQQELIAFHDCIVHDKQPLTDGATGRADILVLQKIFAALHPKGLGGEAGQFA